MDRDTTDRVLAYVRDNLHRELAPGDVAGAFGRSDSWLRVFLRRQTGKSFTALLRELRIGKARRMLAGSGARVADVARACGYRSRFHFAKDFRREVGVSARAYRDRSREPRLPDDVGDLSHAGETTGAGAFPGERLLDPQAFRRIWRTLSGRWSIRDGSLAGESTENLHILLRLPLPPSFRLSFSFLHERSPAHSKRATVIGITDDRGTSRKGFWVLLGTGRNRTHHLSVGGRTAAVVAGAIDLDTWHRVALTHREGVVRLELDGRGIMGHRELLPPPYAARSRLVLGSWDTRFFVRDVEIQSLASTQAPRKTDLANEWAAEGNYERAVEIYEEELRRPGTDERRSETLFKAGICYFGLGLRMRARSCFLRFLEDPSGAYWATLANLYLLETALDDMDDSSLRREIERRFAEAKTPETRDLISDFLLARELDAERVGHPERGLVLARAAYDNAEPGSVRRSSAAMRLLNALLRLRRYKQAADFGERVVGERTPEGEEAGFFRMQLVPVLAAAGRLGKARRLVEAEMHERDSSLLLRSRARSWSGLLLQTAGRFDDAIAAYTDVARDPSAAAASRTLASGNAALLLAVRGDFEEGARLLERSSDAPRETAEPTLRIPWCLHAIQGAFQRILPELDERLFRRREDDREALADRFLLCLLRELTGERERAARDYEVLEKRHADGPLRKLVLPVSYLLGKTPEEELWAHPGCCPLSNSNGDSILFYLMGLAQERRGRPRRAKALFRFAVAADPFRFWAAVLARNKLRNP